MSMEAAIQDFCDRVYELTCARPNRIVLAPVSFDTLAADLKLKMRVIELDDIKHTLGIVLATSFGNVIIERGHS